MLKLRNVVITYLVLICIPVQAQVFLGLSAGVNSSGLSGDNPKNGSYASDYGYNLGGIAEFYFSKDIALRVQPLYSSKSSLVQYDVDYQFDPYDSLAVNTKYLEIPLSLKVVSDNHKSYVTAGIIFGKFLESKVKNNRSGKELNLDQGFENSIWSANFGVGVQFPIGKPLLFIELNYQQSLTNLTNHQVDELSVISKLKINSIQLKTGLLFTLSEL